MGMVGSFIGFTIGGAAATMEVERNMPDAQRYIISISSDLRFGSRANSRVVCSFYGMEEKADSVTERCKCSPRSPKIHARR